MGMESLKQMIKDVDKQMIRLFVLDHPENRKSMVPYEDQKGIEIYWGDLTRYEDVLSAMKGIDLVLHIAAFVSPAADYYPKKAMEVNFGSVRNMINAIYELKAEHKVKVVYIGTVAQTGDRMPPIHWGRVGDPLKPSMFDYYAVSKIAAERMLIESGIKNWVSLRQTGIIGPGMSKIKDAIMFHNCFDNVLEYVSDRDSGRLIGNLCRFEQSGELSSDFWGHIYNIGGGESCRVSTMQLFQELYGAIGLKKLEYVLEPKMQATRNFHGQYYLDSDKLENYLHFRQDSMQYYYDEYINGLGMAAGLSKVICKLPGGQKLMGSIMKRMFRKLALTEHGTVNFIQNNVEDHIDAYWGSKKAWEALPERLVDMEFFEDWDKIVLLDHGYDENKPEAELHLEDMRGAARFRGGKCISKTMVTGDWRGKLKFICAFGHTFEASPRLVLEGGHWCPDCERESWNYANRAERDPFFAQVWVPLHGTDEKRVYPKVVSELDV